MTHSVRRHLRLRIDAYDESIRRWIPGYEAMLQAAASAVASVRPTHVVDLGAGTGGLSQALLQHSEIDHVQLLDVDPEMLDQARIRLAPHGERVDFTLRSFDEPLPSCDAAAASLSLHHVPSLEAKAGLYANIFASLNAGGVLVNADATMPRDPGQAELIYRSWADHMVASGIEESAAWEHFEAWAEEDTYFPLEDELDAMESVGFEAECVWRHEHMTVLVGRK